MAKFIALGNSKGGVGKTTVSLVITDYLANIGKKVLVIDADNNQHSIEEFKDAGLINFDFEIVDSVKKYQSLADIYDIESYDYVLIDTAPHSHTETLFEAIIEDADIVLTVIKPSAKDYFAYNKIMFPVLTHAKKNNAEQEQFLLINLVKHLMNKSQQEAIEAIRSDESVKTLDAMLYDRVFYETLGLEHREDLKAQAEIKALMNELLGE